MVVALPLSAKVEEPAHPCVKRQPQHRFQLVVGTVVIVVTIAIVDIPLVFAIIGAVVVVILISIIEALVIIVLLVPSVVLLVLVLVFVLVITRLTAWIAVQIHL